MVTEFVERFVEHDRLIFFNDIFKNILFVKTGKHFNIFKKTNYIINLEHKYIC